jgi:hypothetical protein
MDEAERRFRACADRFRRDLTQIILRSIDGVVRESLREAKKKEREAIREQVRAEKHARAELLKQQKAAEKAARAEQRKAARSGQVALAGSEAELPGGTQLELKVDLASVRNAKMTAPARVRSDSILGAELLNDARFAGSPLESRLEAALSAPGGSMSPPSAKPASERPLFVHRRARDGQIHALRRESQQGSARKAEGRAEGRAEGAAGSGQAEEC